jgi:hypothetical protein
VAEQIPIDEQEASVSLDQEVQKTHAVFAAALANVDVRPEAGRDSSTPAHESQNNLREEWVSPVAETATAAASMSNIQTDAPFYSAPIEEIRESTPLSETAPVTDTEELESTHKEEAPAAYAAAASAGTGGFQPETNGEVKLLPVNTEDLSDSATPESRDGRRESEMTAAWANWRRIRESIVGSDSTTHVEDANAGYRDSGKEDPPSSPMPSEDVSSSEPHQTEAAEIASIVDTMLAELKPKLMEEIVKKMDTEKKGKKKKKE